MIPYIVIVLSSQSYQCTLITSTSLHDIDLSTYYEPTDYSKLTLSDITYMILSVSYLTI